MLKVPGVDSKILVVWSIIFNLYCCVPRSDEHLVGQLRKGENLNIAISYKQLQQVGKKGLNLSIATRHWNLLLQQVGNNNTFQLYMSPTEKGGEPEHCHESLATALGSVGTSNLHHLQVPPVARTYFLLPNRQKIMFCVKGAKHTSKKSDLL